MTRRGGRTTRETDAAGRPREFAVRGALLGLVIGERLGAPLSHGDLGPLAACALTLTERLCASDRLHDGELARVVIDETSGDPRYERELGQLFAYWETGMPLRTAAAHTASTRGLGGTDFAAAVLAPYALRYADQAERDASVRDAAAILDGDPVAADAAAAFAAAVAAAAVEGDPLAAARRAAQSVELQRALRTVVTLSRQGVSAASLCEHLGTGSRALDAIPTALFCALRAPTFADAVTDALEGASGSNAVPACVGALAGARFGAGGARRLAEAVDPEIRDRVEAIVRTLGSSGAAARTLGSDHRDDPYW
jgi:ADP-ribosylglycohydrolase